MSTLRERRAEQDSIRRSDDTYRALLAEQRHARAALAAQQRAERDHARAAAREQRRASRAARASASSSASSATRASASSSASRGGRGGWTRKSARLSDL